MRTHARLLHMRHAHPWNAQGRVLNRRTGRW
jgi:hypothetical protein